MTDTIKNDGKTLHRVESPPLFSLKGLPLLYYYHRLNVHNICFCKAKTVCCKRN